MGGGVGGGDVAHLPRCWCCSRKNGEGWWKRGVGVGVEANLVSPRFELAITVERVRSANH